MALTRAPSPTVELVPLARLTPAAWNPRLIRDERFRSLVRSIEEDPEFMRNRPILATADGTIYAGNMRYRAAAQAGWTEVPAIIEDIPEAQAKARAVRDNNGWGEWQDEELTELLHDIGNLGGSLDDLGFDPDALAKMLGLDGPTEGLTDPDEIPEVGETPYVKLGDIWQLGDHRVMCGDSTSIEDVRRLMDGRVADMVFTDPPYGVDYDGGTKQREKLIGDGTAALYHEALPLLPADKKASLYLCFGATKADAVFAAVHEAGWEIRNLIIWNKNLAQFGALGARYHDKYEAIIYAHRRGASDYWFGPTNETTVWDIDRARANDLHPTQKPVALIDRAITNSCPPTGLVFDGFLGSGTTLISAQSLGRACFGLEIDPRYAQVSIERWQRHTGQKAQRIEAGDGSGDSNERTGRAA